jgi:hypothetical protein
LAYRELDDALDLSTMAGETSGTGEQWIKGGKGAIKWTRLLCRTFVANSVRLQLHALAYNLGNFLRTLATPEPIKDRSLTCLKEKLINCGTTAAATSASVRRSIGHALTSTGGVCSNAMKNGQISPRPPFWLPDALWWPGLTSR